VRACVPMQGRA